MALKGEELQKISDVFDGHISRIEKLIDLEYLDEAVILIVSVTEVLLRDTFRSSKELWFYHQPYVTITTLDNHDHMETREKIKNYLDDIGVFDEYLKNYYVYERGSLDPETDSLDKTLFGGDISRLSFQRLNERRGARRAYKAFFDIELDKMLNFNVKKSQENWSGLIKLFKERHQVIHNGATSRFSKDELHEIISTLKHLRTSLLSTLISCYGLNTFWDETPKFFDPRYRVGIEDSSDMQ